MSFTEHPFLLLPKLAKVGKRGSKGPNPSPGPHFPSIERQGERLAAKFDRLESSLRSERLSVQATPEFTAPEEVLVLETVGSVADFINTVKKLDGLEWLGEFDSSELEPDDDFYDPQSADKPLTGRLYVLFTNQKGLGEVLSLWRHWLKGDELPHGHKRWKSVFTQLHDIRPWGASDRLHETGAIENWRFAVEHDLGTWATELELWFRASEKERKQAAAAVRRSVESLGGTIHRECLIEEIRYHGIRADLPVKELKRFNSLEDVALVKAKDIQFIRPQSRIILRKAPKESLPGGDLPAPDVTTPPRVALLDGVPVANHPALRGRVQVDDPDEFDATYPAEARVHATAMASLILNGDLTRPTPLQEVLYSRPILRAERVQHDGSWEEVFPSQELIVDLVHRSVRRIFEERAGRVAPQIRCINLSIGDAHRPYLAVASPLARLLDWLSWKYQVLFLISAGNHDHDLSLELSLDEFEQADIATMESHVFRSLIKDQRNRRLLSPAESCNNITIGATWNDLSTYPAQLKYPAGTVELPAIYSGVGPGYQRTVKPDLLFPGGRSIVRPNPGAPSQPTVLSQVQSGNQPGQRVAAPTALNSTTFSRGTSNATALATHQALRILRNIDDLRKLYENWPSEVPESLWVKLLLVHASNWGQTPSHIENVFKERYQKTRRTYLSRFFGFGFHRPERCLTCTPQRATLLGGGLIRSDQGQDFQCPLPPGLSATTAWRRLVYTLVYFTPIVPSRKEYLAADLWVEPTEKAEKILKVKACDVDHNSVKRGTVQHVVLEGKRAAQFIEGANLQLKVSCRPLAEKSKDPIPFALAVTLEAKESSEIPVYQEIRERIRVRPQSRARA